MGSTAKSVILVGLCLGMVCCVPVDEGPPAGEQEGVEAKLRAEAPSDEMRASMMAVLGLSGAEADAVSAAFEARDAAFETFLVGEQGQRLIALEAEMAVAARNQDLAGVRSTTQQATPLREALRKILRDGEQAILDELTPSQQIHWQGHEVSTRLLSTMEPLALTAEQRGVISQAGPEAVSQALNQGELNPSAAAFLALERWVESDVLNEEQRSRYETVKGKKGLRSLGI